MTDLTLRADCAQCAALCCVALAFDRSPLFNADKRAGQPCANLSARNTCSIHSRRAEAGYAGCAMFDCLGAGQRVTALFNGASWRDGPDVARRMFDAFHAMRRIHELLLLLREAARLPLSVGQRHTQETLQNRLQASASALPALDAFARSGLAVETEAFLRTLRSVARSGD